MPTDPLIGAILSQKESFNNGVPSASIEMIVSWAGRFSAAQSFYGRYSAGSSWITPSMYTGLPGLYCVGVDCEPYNGVATTYTSEGVPQPPKYCKLTVTYGMPEVPISEEGSPDDSGEEKLSISGETMTLGASGYKWTEGDKSGEVLTDKDVAPIKIMPSMTYSVTYQFKKDIDPSDFSSYVGKINSAAFGTRGFAENTVMYLGAECDRKLAFGGNIQYWKVTHNFAIKTDNNASWNRFWDGSAWSAIQSVAGSSYVYETADLNDIFDL